MHAGTPIWHNNYAYITRNGQLVAYATFAHHVIFLVLVSMKERSRDEFAEFGAGNKHQSTDLRAEASNFRNALTRSDDVCDPKEYIFVILILRQCAIAPRMASLTHMLPLHVKLYFICLLASRRDPAMSSPRLGESSKARLQRCGCPKC